MYIVENAEKKEKHMSNFNLNDFFAAFNSLKARGTATVKNTTKQSSCKSCPQQSSMPEKFECKDEDVKFECSSKTEKSGWHCRHTKVEEPVCTCEPEPTCDCKPKPTCECKPKPPMGNANFGIIDGPGDDVYAKNVTINTFNTTNNFYKQEVTPDPTVPDPTVPEPTPPGPSTPDEPAQVDLMPLRSLLTGIEARTPDGVLSDKELNRAMSNSTIADLDGNPDNISAEEMAIFNQIQEFNKDKDLISNVIKGDYSNISEATLNELLALSNRIKALTKY